VRRGGVFVGSGGAEAYGAEDACQESGSPGSHAEALGVLLWGAKQWWQRVREGTGAIAVGCWSAGLVVQASTRVGGGVV
jgi:hypothetical protein